MTRIVHSPASAAVTAEHPVAVAGRLLVRYGLVVVIAWIGALKYTAYEATAIQPLIAHSPLMSWLYNIFSVRALAAVLGTAEIIAAVLIALRPLSARASAVGSAFGILLFLSTLSFLFTTPGVTVARPADSRCCRCCPASSCSRTSCWSARRCGRWATRSAPPGPGPAWPGSPGSRSIARPYPSAG